MYTILTLNLMNSYAQFKKIPYFDEQFIIIIVLKVFKVFEIFLKHFVYVSEADLKNI